MAVKHKIRMKNGKYKIVELTARKAIMEFCLECMMWDRDEVKKCTAPNCPLFPFRKYGTPKSTV